MNHASKGSNMKLSRSTTARAATLVLALVAMAAFVAGCTETIDTGQLESDLTDQLSGQAGVNPADVSVSCPDDEEAEEGNKFNCTLTAPNGDPVTVEVTITDGGDSFEAEVPPQQFK
jgi:uncharacterized protein DUF4333